MPETPMDEDHCPVFGENEVRFARQVLHMQTIAVAKRMQRFPERQFGLGVAAFYRAHHFGALLRREDVCAGGDGHAAAAARFRTSAGVRTVSLSQRTTGTHTPSPHSLSAAVEDTGKM